VKVDYKAETPQINKKLNAPCFGSNYIINVRILIPKNFKVFKRE